MRPLPPDKRPRAPLDDADVRLSHHLGREEGPRASLDDGDVFVLLLLLLGAGGRGGGDGGIVDLVNAVGAVGAEGGVVVGAGYSDGVFGVAGGWFEAAEG